MTLEIYDLLGTEVTALEDRVARTAGRYSATWDGRSQTGASLASGTYFYRLAAGDDVRIGRMVLSR